MDGSEGSNLALRKLLAGADEQGPGTRFVETGLFRSHALDGPAAC